MKYHDHTVIPHIGHYHTGNPMLSLKNPLVADMSMSEYMTYLDTSPTSQWRASSNLPGLTDDEIAVKDYSENKGMLHFLLKHDIVEPPYRYIQSGFCEFPICKIRNYTPPEICTLEVPEWLDFSHPRKSSGRKKWYRARVQNKWFRIKSTGRLSVEFTIRQHLNDPTIPRSDYHIHAELYVGE